MRSLLLLSLLFCSGLTYGQELSKEYQVIVSNFIDCVKNNKREKISEMIRYPLGREYPIPAIKDKQEFVKRYAEIFDEPLKQLIVNSKPTTDWTEVGWRGIMLGSGDVWIDPDGRLYGVNYQSKSEEKKRTEIVENERKTLHPSLLKYKEPVCILETKKFRIRIDDLGDNYRYASWPINKTMSEKPDLVLEEGEIVREGTGGNHHFTFKNGEYTYECMINVIRTAESPPAQLIIYKGEKEILSENATILN
jgi:hypothetical protein